MAKYYFLILGVLYGLFGQSQECDWRNVLDMKYLWSGDVDRFKFSDSDGWQLRDTEANTSTLVFQPDSMTSMLHFSFSLDFAPSNSNQFQMKLNLQSADSPDSAFILLSVGESGNEDGLRIDYFSGNDKIAENNFWVGQYGEGVHRASWIISVNHLGLLISDGGTGRSEMIPWASGAPDDYFINSVVFQCIYTKTRASHFTFHHLYRWPSGSVYIPTVESGNIFFTECRYVAGSRENFIEIYNTWDEPVCLSGLWLEINEETVNLPVLQFLPGQHIILTDSTSSFISPPDILRIPVRFPEINESDDLEILLYLYDRLLHGARFSSKERERGLASLEMIDVSQPCRTDNWAPSIGANGSAGMENSRFSTLDPPLPEFNWASPTVGEVMLPYLLIDDFLPENILTANYPIVVDQEGVWGNLEIHFEDELNTVDSVRIRLDGLFTDCSGGQIDWDTTFISPPPETGKPQGLLLTELMYQPLPGCPEYLEITNLELKSTWWDNLQISKNEGKPIPIPVSGEWPAAESRVFTEDRYQFLECYSETNADVVYEADLITLNNDGATLTLSSGGSEIQIIDQIHYAPSAHNYFIRDPAGVALERNIKGTQGNKWRSGFVQLGYRSPGFLPEWDLSSGIEVDFSTSVIYAGSDREPSLLEIEVGSENLDGSMTIEIFDLNGRNIQTLANAVPVQGGEVFIWEGRLPNGRLLAEGLYLFWIYYFDLIGHKKIIKRTCVLSNK